MLKGMRKIVVVMGIFASATASAENWFVGGNVGVDASVLNPTSVNLASAFNFGYKWTDWDVFGEVSLFGGALKGGADYLINLDRKSYMNIGVLAGVGRSFDAFTVGGQFGYNYYIMPELTIGGGGRVEGQFGNPDSPNLNISGLFTVAYHIP